MKCPYCNQENKDTALMCEFCGERFDNTKNVAVNKESVSTNNLNEDSKKSTSAPILIGIIGLLAVVGLLFALAGGSGSKDGANLMEASLNVLFADSYEVQQVIELTNIEVQSNDPSAAMAANMIKGLKLEINHIANNKDFKYEGDINISLQGMSFFGGEYFLSKESGGVKIPMMYPSALYVEWLDLVGLIQEEANGSFDFASFEPYKELLDFKSYDSYKNLSLDKYVKFYDDFYDSKITGTKSVKEELVTKNATENVSGKEYAMKFSYEDAEELNRGLFQIIKEDANLKAFIVEFSSKFIDIVIENQDYVMYGLLNGNYNVANWESYMEDELKALKLQIEPAITYVFGQLDTVYSEIYDDPEYVDLMDKIKMDFDAKYFVDNNNFLRKSVAKMTMDMDIEGEIIKLEMTVSEAYNKINEEVDFAGYGEDAVNVGKLSMEELEALFGSIYESLGGDMFFNSFGF